MPVKAAFNHPFQTAPADMYHGDFSVPRQAALKARLDDIRSGDISILERHLLEKQGIANDWVNWGLWTEAFWQQLMPLLKGTRANARFERKCETKCEASTNAQAPVLLHDQDQDQDQAKTCSAEASEQRAPNEPHLGAWLASLIEHMLVSPKERRSGWPDLLLIDHGELKFVEVKGPGDRLAPHQTDWLKWLNENGTPGKVLYVNYLE